MSAKSVYMYKVVIRDTQTNEEVPVNAFNRLFQEVFDRESINNALNLGDDTTEPMILDIIEDTDQYLFARLNRKRPNNSMQKRNYTTYQISDVLAPNEIEDNGVEWFTYCIMGYTHGILSIVNSKGAPSSGALARVFARYNNRYSLETEPIPNVDLLYELMEGTAPEINRVTVDIARPNASVLEDLFGFREPEIFEAIGENVSKLVFEIKPEMRGALSNNPGVITRLINALRANKRNFNSVVISGKAHTQDRQRSYDLYEEYFKYPISISEFKQIDGVKVERDKNEILEDYRTQMMDTYNAYKSIILNVSDR